MFKLRTPTLALAFAASLSVGTAFAQSPATTPSGPPAASTAPATASPAMTGKKAEKPRTAASLECSKEADGKSLHGKERKKFMSQCKKAAKTGGAMSK